MSTFKKLLALTLALAMVLSVSAFAGYKADTYADADKIDEDCEDAVELMYALDIMVGDGKNFNPESTVTRAEMAKMIYVVLNYGDDDKAANYTGAKIFSDVASGAWYEGYVNYCGTTKLVQGRPDGTFGPMDPVTCAEAAKMLLTAIGYSAADRGYTGAEWANNVLSDAAIVGLLEDYNYNTNTYAPRQWVAVMMENALWAYTYATVRPVSFNGLLTSSALEKYNEATWVTMGQKYYKLNTFTGYLYATEDAYIDQAAAKWNSDDNVIGLTTTADDDCAIFYNSSNGYIEVDNPGLGYMDLGQKYRVIYKNNGSVYSCKATGDSEVADAIAYEITVDTARATNKNDANNKYVFTIGDMEAKFNSSNIKAITVNNKVDFDNDKDIIVDTDDGDKYAKGGYSVDELKAVAGDKSADLYRAIDKDGDGDIDYMIIVEYTYAYVNKVGEHKSYGEYFTAELDNEVTYKPAGYSNDGGKWYLDDVVNTDDEIEKGNFIKVNYNLDNAAYDVEVLAVEDEVTYEKRSTKGVHTLGGEEYVIADKAFDEAAAELVSGNLKDAMTIVVDGEFIVYAEPVDSDYTDLADVNAQLVMVTAAYKDDYSNSSYDRKYIEYMTIDGELHEEVRYLDGKDTADTDDDANVNYDEIAGYLAKNQRLFALREKDGKVYLIKLDADNAQDILDYSSSLLDGYRETTDTLDTDDNEFGNDYVENENEFFVSYVDEDGDLNFTVSTIDELGEGVDKNAFIQGLYETKRSYDIYLAGHLYLPNLELDQATGYLYTTSGDAYDVDDDEWYLMDVVFDDGEAEGDIMVSKVDGVKLSAGAEVKANVLYSYTYKMDNGEKVYNLTLVDDKAYDFEEAYDEDGNLIGIGRIDAIYGENQFDELTDDQAGSDYEIVNVYTDDNGDEWVVADHEGLDIREKLEMASSYDIVLKKVVLDRDETQTDDSDDLYFDIETEISFIDFATLEANDDSESELPFDIYNGESDDTYDYYSDYRAVISGGKIKMLYVITYAVEIEAQ